MSTLTNRGMTQLRLSRRSLFAALAAPLVPWKKLAAPLPTATGVSMLINEGLIRTCLYGSMTATEANIAIQRIQGEINAAHNARRDAIVRQIYPHAT